MRRTKWRIYGKVWLYNVDARKGRHDEERKVVGSVYSIYAYHQKLSIYFGGFVGTVFQQTKFR
jgi:hypothetical protein